MIKKLIYSLFGMLLIVDWLAAQNFYLVKMATVAPEGSSWMKEFRTFEEDMAKLTNNRLRFKVYPNAVQGGEKDVLRKMQLGQLDAGSFTGVGLGELVPEVRVFDLPFLFRNSAEVDYVAEALLPQFQEKFSAKGYFLAGWAEVGFVYLLTRNPVTQLSDFKNVKMWLWKGDPLAQATFEEMHIAAIPLDITDVHTSLQTGLIDGVYISPYGALALQWYAKTRYMLNYPLTNSIGAILITRKKLESIPPDIREIFIERTKIQMRKIIEGSRKENQESIKVLEKNGITLVNPKNQTAIAEFEASGKRTREKLAGKLYSQELLHQVLQLLEEYRRDHKN